MTVRMNLTGFDQVKKRLEDVGEEMATKSGQAAIRASAKTVSDAVKAAVPVSDEDKRSPMSKLYGHIRDNIKIRKGKPRKAHTVSSIVTVGSSFWARFLEFGTSKMAAQPFFKPAFEALRDKLVNDLAGNLNKALDRAIKRASRRP